jgi:elongation factor 2
MMGMGELHLEIIEHRITRDFGLEITTSEPLVVYRECVAKNSDVGGQKGFEGKSPNKHNKFYFIVEPLEEKVTKAIHDNVIPTDVKKHSKEAEQAFVELGWEKDVARKVKHIEGTNVLVDGTKGIQNLFETMELVKDGFKEAVTKGPLAGEPVQGVKVTLTDAKLHEDAIHRGPAQVIPAVRNGVYGAMVRGERILLEPMQKVVVDVPQDLMGDVTREMQHRRGVIEDMQGEGDRSVIQAKAPVSEMFGFSAAIRSATQGRALWSTENLGFEPLDRSLLDKIVREIRERKGLKPEPYDEDYYAS